MASKSMCSKCLRLATSSVPSRSVPRRAFTAAAAKQPSQPQRKIHSSTRHEAATAAQPAQSSSSSSSFSSSSSSSFSSSSSSSSSSFTSSSRTVPAYPTHDAEQKVLLQPNNLFHSFTNSPSPAIRKRAALMRQNAYCPHPEHQATRAATSPHDLEARKTGSMPPAHVRYECPDCGVPVSCSEEHFVSDYESHLEICDVLREINEDDHDLNSGRFFPEFEYPGPQLEEAQVNLQNWDTLLYSREFEAINEERPLRQVTRLLTYPITIGSVLHELSPYSLSHRLEPEGLRSLAALRYTLHPPRSGGGTDIKGLRTQAPPIRLFILGARAESSLPRQVWLQLSYLFPRATFHLIFIGPESMANRDDEFPLPERTPQNPYGAIVEDRLGGQMKISTYVEYFHTLHEAQHFYPYDPYFDAFVCFHPGFGHPASSHEWAETLPQLLETKVPVICTGYTEYDMKRDIDWVTEQAKGEMDLLLQPGENRFRSLRWDLNDLDPGDVSCGNWGIWGFRGKRYETDEYRGGQQAEGQQQTVKEGETIAV